jgi:hypothetical protein
MTDRASPMGFILFTIFTSVLLWVYALIQHLPIR